MAGAGDCNCSPPQPGRNEGSVTTPDIMEERNLEPPGCKSSPVFQFISSFFWFIDLFKYGDEYFIGLFASCIVNIVAKSFTERS